MNRIDILIAVKQRLATDAGQPDKRLAICNAVDGVVSDHRLRGESRTVARAIQNEVMDYLSPHLTFRRKLKATHSIKQIQYARHQYLDDLIKEAS